MSFSPNATMHGGGDAFDFLELVGDAELLAASLVLRFDARDVILRTRLDLGCRVLVEAFDGRDFARIHIGEFLDGAETFRGEELADHLVDVEGVHEQFGALGEFLLAALQFLGLGQDVDVPAGQLRGEAHVLAAAADGERELVVGHHHFDAVRILVEHHLDDFAPAAAR